VSTTETEQQFEERFKEYCQEHSLKPKDTAEYEQHLAALGALHTWLKKGASSAETVIRAVQVMLLEPEQPGVHKRPAVKYVLKQVTKQWKSAGLEERDVSLLRGMLLCAWPSSVPGRGQTLVSLLSRALTTVRQRQGKDSMLSRWIQSQASQGSSDSLLSSHERTSTISKPPKIELDDLKEKIKNIPAVTSSYHHVDSAALTKHLSSLFASFSEMISSLAGGITATHKELTRLQQETLVASDAEALLSAVRPKLEILWWGQSRYSPSLRSSYRQIKDQHERLWWMAWDASALSLQLDVEPAACFLTEKIQEVGLEVHAEQTLKEWLLALFKMLRGLETERQSSIAMSAQLTNLAREEPLGLPVTWTRLQAAEPRISEAAFEQQLEERVALALDTKLDLGDWAAWIFRESLLDRHLGDK
jgi:hypothetical protein